MGVIPQAVREVIYGSPPGSSGRAQKVIINRSRVLPQDVSNPAVTFRVPPEDRARLERLTAKTGKSLGQLLRENLGVAERDVQSAYDRGWDQGLAIGIEEGRKGGKEAWAIYYYCCVCREKIEVRPNSPVHQAIVNALHERKWGHKACHESTR